MIGSPSKAPTAPYRRLAVTLGLLLVVGAMPHVGLPGVDTSGLESKGKPFENLDLFALGIIPFLSAAYLVELVALVRPRWRALRHGGPEGRGKLGRAMWIVAVVLCVFQSFGVARLVESLSQTEPVGAFSIPVVVLSMTAGALLLGLAAQLASARGLAGGFAVLSVGLPLVGAIRHLRADVGGGALGSPVDLGVQAALVVAVIAVTCLVLRTPRAAASDPARPAIAPPTPASGLSPLLVAPALLALPATLASLNVHIPGAAALSSTTPYRIASLLLIVLSALYFTWAFNAPARVAALARRAGAAGDPVAEARGGMRGALLRSLAFVVALFAIGQASLRFSGVPLGVPALVLLTALVLDLVAEWRARVAVPDLVPVWPEHRSYAVPIARDALAAAGITLHARGERLHRLLQFFGPYAPVDLMVPRGDEARAADILKRVLLVEPDAAEPETKPAPAAPRPWTRPEMIALGAALALAGGALLLPGPAPLVDQPTSPLRPDAILLLPVDDDADAFDPEPKDLPTGVSFVTENVPLGRDSTGVRRHARMVKQGGESLQQAQDRLMTWAAARTLPPGDRVLPAAVQEYDDDKARYDVIGWRTYVVKSAPVIDGSHVRGARAARDPRDFGLGGWHVRVEMSPEGAERFRAFTAANIKRRLAIVVDGVVESAPVIQSEIPGGTVTITMGAGEPEEQERDAKQLERRLLGR